jgi:SAM-dependent methyltransferase
LSDNMAQKFNKHAEDAGLPLSRINATQGNLLDEEPTAKIMTAEYYNFDIATISLALHHIALDNQLRLCQKLGERLKPGGKLVILDFVQEGRSPTDKLHEIPDQTHRGVSTTGFTHEELKALYEGAGFADFEMSIFEKQVFMNFNDNPKHRTVFLSKGTKV